MAVISLFIPAVMNFEKGRGGNGVDQVVDVVIERSPAD